MTASPVIAFTVHNRPEYLQAVLESWAAVRGVEHAELIFRCEPGCDETVALCESVTFARKTQVIVNSENFGVLANPWHAMETSFATGAPFAILCEEDTPVSDDILEFFAFAQARYACDPDVVAVCAHQLGKDHDVSGGDADVLRHPHFSPIVWGTWRERWDGFFRATWDFNYSRRGWDWNVNRMIGEQGKHIVMPARSRSQHIGEHGGIHCSPDFYPQTVSVTFSEHYEPQDYRERG